MWTRPRLKIERTELEMSASDKKQQRKAALVDGLTQKELKERRDAQAAARRKTIYTIIGVVCAVAVAALLIWDNIGNFTGRPNTSAVAATVNGVDYKVSDLQYHYARARLEEYYNYSFYAQIGAAYPYNPYLSDGAQWYNEAEGLTYADYFRDRALALLKEDAALCAAAKAAGYTLSEEGQATIDSQLNQMDAYRSQYGLSRTAWLAQQYGSGVTEAIFLRNLTNELLADEYEKYHNEQITYDDASLQEYYKDHTDTLDSYTFRVFPISGVAANPTDENGNPLKNEDGTTVTATDEEKAAAMAQAKEKAEQAVAEIQEAEDKEQAFIDAAPKYVADSVKEAYKNSSYTLQKEIAGSMVTGASYGEWLSDSSRQKYDVTYVETSTSYFVVMFLDRYLVQEHTVNVRHILIQPETSPDAEANSSNVKIPTQEQMDAARAKLQTILDEWNALPADEKTPVKFGELAEEYSADGRDGTGNLSTPGGRYTYVRKGDMVANFDAWIFDSSRQSGDVGMVENSGDSARYYGWHLIYFEGIEEPYWKKTATEAKQANDQAEWKNGLIDSVTAAKADGMKYVGQENTAQPSATPTPAESETPTE